MRRFISVVAALSVAIVTTIVMTGTRSAADDDERDGAQVINLVANNLPETDIDLGAPGPSAGDQIVFADLLFRGGTQVGDDGGTCQVVRVAGQTATLHCVGSLRLPAGQITVQGLIDFSGVAIPPPFVIAVTGGTGAYQRAHGQMRITTVSDTVERYRIWLSR